MVPPEPSHHVGEDRAALLLPVAADPPRVVHVVALFRQRLHQPDVLQEPVTGLVVGAVGADATVVVAAVLQEHPYRLAVVLPYEVTVRMAAAQVREAADDA